MEYMMLLLAAIFLPLFPFSMIFNIVFARVRHPVLRGMFLLAWPQAGLLVLLASGVAIPAWVSVWAVLTSLLYSLRALVLRELGAWTSFVGTSAWALLWILHGSDSSMLQLQIAALGISAPLALMAFLLAGLERRFSAAYLGLYGGLAQSLPRFTGVLVIVVLAIIATPLFPTFFVMLSMVIKTLTAAPAIAAGIGVVWLLWSWAGARLLQGLITGSDQLAVADLGQTVTWGFVVALAALMALGVFSLGGML